MNTEVSVLVETKYLNNLKERLGLNEIETIQLAFRLLSWVVEELGDDTCRVTPQEIKK